MSVNDFLDMLFFEDIRIEIYVFNIQKTVFKGTVDDAKEKYGEYEMDSFDITESGALNINLTIDEVESEDSISKWTEFVGYDEHGMPVFITVNGIPEAN